MKNTTISIFIVLILVFVFLFNKMDTELKEKNNLIDLADLSVQEGFTDSIQDSVIEEEIYEMFPDIDDARNLKTDLKLPPLKFLNFPDTLDIAENAFSFEIELISKIKSADIYMYINGKKKDMYFHCGPGKYNFADVKFQEGESKVEFFYKSGNKRSQSVYCVVNKK
jgi:hypothetical protein